MGDVLKKFGRYFLLDHIAQGGMAEIYRARMASSDGAGRLIVIKKVIAGYGNNKEFLQMFKSEIKVTMGFNHPNIVQLYDYGEEQGQPYIAMELVDGKNLRQFISRFNELNQSFPVDLATFIAEQCASGLHYAHSYKDKISGDPLNIVHRDISPQNILISFEGNIKVIDFGIAKATTNMESTRAGVIKGKPSYLSPEQISGEVLDGRSDIFALGAVLWEMLTGRKLFSGENDLAVLKLIESSQSHVKPPSKINPKVPKELDYIVLKTLAKSRDSRYRTAEELQRALHKFLYSYSPEFNPSDLSYYAKDLFKNEIVEDRKNIQRLNEKVEQLLASNIPSLDTGSAPNGDPGAQEEETTTVAAKLKQSSARDVVLQQSLNDPNARVEIQINPGNHQGNSPGKDLNKTHSEKITKTGSSTASHIKVVKGQPNFSSQDVHNATPVRVEAPINRGSASKSKGSSGFLGKLIGVAAAALLLLSFFGQEFGVKVPVLSDLLGDWVGGSEARLYLDGRAQGITISLNGQNVAANSLPTVLNGLPIGTPFRIQAYGPNGTFQQDLTLKKGEKKHISVNFTPSTLQDTPQRYQASVPEKSIYLRLNITPGGGNPRILVSGKPVSIVNPVIAVALDAPLELLIDRPGFKTFKREFVLDSRQVSGLKEWLMDVNLDPTHFGYLTIHTTPSADATILLDGSPWKKKTPIENEKMPVGVYKIRLANEVLGMEKLVTVTIKEGKAVNIDERLEIKN